MLASRCYSLLVLLALAQAPGAMAASWVLAERGETCNQGCTQSGLGSCESTGHASAVALTATEMETLLTNTGAYTDLNTGGLNRQTNILNDPLNEGTVPNQETSCPIYNYIGASGVLAPCSPGNTQSTCANGPYYSVYRLCCCGTGSCSVSAGSVAGDPITYYGNRRVEFHLPVHQPILLLKTFDFSLFGITFPGYLEDQWFKRLVLTDVAGKKIVDVSIKKDLVSFNRSALPDSAFDTLDVVMWDARPTPLTSFPPYDAFFKHHGITVTFVRQRSPAVSQFPRRECAIMGSLHAKIVTCSTSAHEYFGFGSGSYQYAHLDIEVHDMHHDGLTGVLPELWGIASMSAATKDYILSSSRVGPVPNDGGRVLPTSATVDIVKAEPVMTV